MSIGPSIVGAVIFLAIGFLCAVKPYLLQRTAVRLYKPPFAEPKDWHVPFLESAAYIVMLRLIGGVCLAVGLVLTAIIIGAILVPGFADLRQ